MGKGSNFIFLELFVNVYSIKKKEIYLRALNTSSPDKFGEITFPTSSGLSTVIILAEYIWCIGQCQMAFVCVHCWVCICFVFGKIQILLRYDCLIVKEDECGSCFSTIHVRKRNHLCPNWVVLLKVGWDSWKSVATWINPEMILRKKTFLFSTILKFW